jgi:uncharacterized damage-inducible protein DinB
MQLSALFSHWQQIHQDTLQTIARFTPNDLSFKPFETSWTAAQIMLHIADAEAGWFQYVVQRQLTGWPEQYTPENYPTLADIHSALEEVHQQTQQYIASLDEGDLEREIISPWGDEFRLGWIIWHVLEHEIHHRGELSLILGLLDREGLDV